MSENIRNSYQRLKILYLYKILLEQTDEEHYITMPQIINQLKLYGINAERKALYEDIEALRAFGLDIISLKGKISGYYVASRDFELPELRLLADAVSSARFLTEKKSQKLLNKIEGLTSIYEAGQIHRQVYLANSSKTINESIYINIDLIHKAINKHKKISFKYFDYTLDKDKAYRKGLRCCSPIALVWNSEHYYLVSYYDKYENISNFRVDRMEGIEIMHEDATEIPDEFNIPEYVNSTFSMFGDEKTKAKIRFENKLIDAVIDRFGKDITIFPDGADYFIIRTDVNVGSPFFAWLFQFEESAEIISPEWLKEEYIEKLRWTLESMSY